MITIPKRKISSQTFKKLTAWKPKIRSRHPSHGILRTELPLLPFKSVVRLGSTTDIPDTIDNGGKRVECNTIEAIRNSSSKLKMKQCFLEAGVKTADWGNAVDVDQVTDKAIQFKTDKNGSEGLLFPIVAKSFYGSRGEGNTLIKTKEELEVWKKGKTISHYIFEAFHNYGLEFRLHITEEGCFYTCRKGLKADVPESEKWRRHDDICVWLMETNPDFKKPASWDDIVSDCVKALKAIGADVLSFDVKVQGATTGKGNLRDYQDYILIECNSASSMSNGVDAISVCASKYIEEIPKILRRKYNAIYNL